MTYLFPVKTQRIEPGSRNKLDLRWRCQVVSKRTTADDELGTWNLIRRKSKADSASAKTVGSGWMRSIS